MFKKIQIIIFIFLNTVNYAQIIQPVSKTLFRVLDDNSSFIKEVDLKW